MAYLALHRDFCAICQWGARRAERHSRPSHAIPLTPRSCPSGQSKPSQSTPKSHPSHTPVTPKSRPLRAKSCQGQGRPSARHSTPNANQVTPKSRQARASHRGVTPKSHRCHTQRKGSHTRVTPKAGQVTAKSHHPDHQQSWPSHAQVTSNAHPSDAQVTPDANQRQHADQVLRQRRSVARLVQRASLVLVGGRRRQCEGEETSHIVQCYLGPHEDA